MAANLRLQPGQMFGQRYCITRLLGEGGMGAVYEAADRELGVPVALKLIKPDISADPTAALETEWRFKRELLLARQVTHKNVVRIHDLGEVEGTKYISMSYVQGSDLATILERDGSQPIPRALHVVRAVASGLLAAHEAGVVHRDLKPANIMVASDGDPLIMDFGIARSAATAEQPVMSGPLALGHPSAGGTMVGSVLGTTSYMAPEQARGDAVDHRADIYALGLIAYDMLSANRMALCVRNRLDELKARMERAPVTIAAAEPRVPRALERIIMRCLQPDPSHRYQTTKDLISDLDRLDPDGRLLPVVRRVTRRQLSATAVLVLGLLGGTWWVAQPAPPPVTPAPMSVLIVDFDNRANEAVFRGSLEEALSIEMEGAGFITAFPRKDAARLVKDLKFGETIDENAGRLLANREGIPVILTGMVDRNGSGYRLVVSAFKPDAQEPLAVAEARASQRQDVLTAVGGIARRLRSALGDTAASIPQQGETFTAASLEAVHAYTVAQELASNHKTEEAVLKYQDALRYDPEFGRAYSGLALAISDLGRRQEAEEYWREALRRLDRMTEREKLRTVGSYFLAVSRNPEKAIEAFDELVAKYPADSAGHNNLAVAHFSMLNFTKALEEGRRAIEIYPRTAKYRANYALYAMYAGDFEAAASTAQALLSDESVWLAHLPLAMEAMATGDPQRARAAYAQAERAGETGASLSEIGLADIYIYEGRYGEAIAFLQRAIPSDERRGNTSGVVAKLVALGEAHAALGQHAASQTAIARARSLTTGDNVLVPAARLALAAGRTDDARRIAAELGGQLPAQSRAYGKMIEAEIALASRMYPLAIDDLNAAHKLADLWLIRFVLGLAYFNRGEYTEASSEFQRVRDRRGEATAIFLDDLPTFRYYVQVPYWLGRAREMQKLDPLPQYEEFLSIRGASTTDPLVQDVRRRIDALKRRG